MLTIDIYKITNLVTGKVYIGQTQDYDSRVMAHKSTLVRDAHHNKPLQNDWNKYGESSFEFCKIDYALGEDKALELEKQYIKQYKGNCYNIMGRGNTPKRWQIIIPVPRTEEEKKAVEYFASLSKKDRTEFILGIARRMMGKEK